MSLRRPKPPIKGGSAPEEEEEDNAICKKQFLAEFKIFFSFHSSPDRHIYRYYDSCSVLFYDVSITYMIAYSSNISHITSKLRIFAMLVTVHLHTTLQP